MRKILPPSLTGAAGLVLLLSFAVLKGMGIVSYWTDLCLGLGIALLAVALFLLTLFLLSRQKKIDVAQGVVCPRCKEIYPKEEERCPRCGEKNPFPKKDR